MVAAVGMDERWSDEAVGGVAVIGWPPNTESRPTGQLRWGAINCQSATSRRKLPSGFAWSPEAVRPYGVRSAVTSRASRTIALGAGRRGGRKLRNSARPAASSPCRRCGYRAGRPWQAACGTLASTCGAKPGKTVSAAAMNAATAMAERALIMTVPCHGPWRPVVSLDGLVASASFRMSSPTSGNGFVRRRVLFRRQLADETMPARHGRRLEPETGSVAERNKKAGTGGNQPGLPGRPGRGRGAYAPYRALSRLFRPRHQRPSGRGPARRRPLRPPDRRHRGPSRQKAAVFDRGAPGHGPGGIRAGRRQGRLRLRLPPPTTISRSRRRKKPARPS